MTDYAWEQALEAGSDIQDDPSVRNPVGNPWGYFSGSTFVLATPEVFHWFSSPHEMLTWMQKAEPKIQDLEPAERDEVAKRVQNAIDSLVSNGNTLTPEIFSTAKAALSEKIDFKWWGHFDELLKGTSAFAVGIRHGFRGDESEDEEDLTNSAPIDAEELDNFIEYLANYGV